MILEATLIREEDASDIRDIDKFMANSTWETKDKCSGGYAAMGDNVFPAPETYARLGVRDEKGASVLNAVGIMPTMFYDPSNGKYSDNITIPVAISHRIKAV